MQLIFMITAICVTGIYCQKCLSVNEKKSFCLRNGPPRLECPVGFLLSIRWAEIRVTDRPCDHTAVDTAHLQDSCVVVTGELKKQCDGQLRCSPVLPGGQTSRCGGNQENTLLQIRFQCDPVDISGTVFRGMCDSKERNGSVLHIDSAVGVQDIGCRCIIAVPGNTEVELLAQQTTDLTKTTKCPQTIQIQDVGMSRKQCMPKMGEVAQMNCYGSPQYLTIYYTHVKIRGHALIIRASHNAQLTVTCGKFPPSRKKLPTAANRNDPGSNQESKQKDGQDKEMEQAGLTTDPNQRSLPNDNSALLGGVIGAAVCLITFLTAVLIYLLYQRRMEGTKTRTSKDRENAMINMSETADHDDMAPTGTHSTRTMNRDCDTGQCQGDYRAENEKYQTSSGSRNNDPSRSKGHIYSVPEEGSSSYSSIEGDLTHQRVPPSDGRKMNYYHSDGSHMLDLQYARAAEAPVTLQYLHHAADSAV